MCSAKNGWHKPKAQRQMASTPRRAARLVAALTLATFALLMSAPGPAAVATAASHDLAPCAPETTTCTQVPFPCSSCSASAGPVVNLGQGQSVYVLVDNLPQGDEVGIGFCSLKSGNQVASEPQCASSIPPQPGCVTLSGTDCPNTPSPLEWTYGTVTSGQTLIPISTDFNPNVAGANPIVSQTPEQFISGTYGGFFCDNGPADPCGVEVVDIPAIDVVGNGYPPRQQFVISSANAIVIPLSWASTGNGCGSAPVMQVDAAFSVAQFLPAAGAATCTGSNGIAVLPTSLPSVDDKDCSLGTGTHCPITDVINGSVPATFTDDPEDPATLAAEQSAGGKFAYIPIAVSATEIAFEGEAGVVASGSSRNIPLSSYRLTPAQTAGIMTQFWNSPVSAQNAPNDNACGQLSGKAKCIETMQTQQQSLFVNTINNKYENIDISTGFGGTPKKLPFNTFTYLGNDNYTQQSGAGSQKDYSSRTAYALLNPWPLTEGNFRVNEGILGAMFPSTGSGTVFETSGWLCGAPNPGYTADLPFGGQASLKDIMTSQQLLADAEQGPLAVTKESTGYVISSTVDQYTLADPGKCQAVSTLPTDFGTSQQSTGDQYNPSSSPLTAAHTISGAMSAYAGQGGFAFSAMDSSEADFYGLLPASLQNAAGNFTGPTPSSVLAALNDAKIDADGTLSPDYTNSTDTNAYPMPMVTYALVSTAPQPSLDTATKLKNMLTNLVGYSHTSGANTGQPLPAGYEPLPDNLYQLALTDISQDIVGPSGTSPSSGGSSGSGSAAGTGSATSAPTSHPAAGSTGGAHPTGGSAASPSGLGATQATGPASGRPSGSSGNYVGHLLTVTVADSRYFVPGLLLFALLCLAIGPLLYMYPSLRRAADRGGGGTSDHERGETAVPTETR